MSQGTIPDALSGGILVASLPAPVGVMNAYIPPATFTVSCPLRFYGSDCNSTRFDPQQINAFESEMLCLAVAMSPNGTWNCGSTCNLGTAFANYLAGAAANTAATDTVKGIVALSVAANQPQPLNDVDAITPAGVATYLQSLGAIVAAPIGGNSPSMPTTFYGTNANYLGSPVRWISLTLPGIPGVVTFASYT